MKWKIPLFKIFWDREDLAGVSEAIKEGMYWAEGSNIKEFEKKIAEFIGTKYCVAFSSGTAALHAALVAHGIVKGDEVIVPSFTFIATANAPLFLGAKPVFAEIEEKNFGLDPGDVREKINKRTRVIIPVHYGGGSCEIKELREIANDHSLIMIEDAAEAFGAKSGNQMIGTFGDSAMFSFCQNKIIATGEGGAIVTDSKKLLEKLRLIRSHGRSEKQKYFVSSESADYVTLGYNFRMSNITAALGISQLKKVEKLIELRRKVAARLDKELSGISAVLCLPPSGSNYHVYQLYTIRVDSKIRNALKEYLTKKGIMTKVFFEPVHLTHFYKKVLGYNFKLEITENISKEVLSLPIYPGLKEEETDFIGEQIRNFVSGVTK
ncbi:MAG: DegT/DnrJ/EryC1/StrS family aminotransferase [Candidatus Hodarchaeales archaeon]|jgi:perosamine synthetase